MVDYLKQFEEKHRPLLNLASKFIFFALLGGFVIIAWMRGGVDFRGYYGAAWLVREGGNPYDYTQLAPVLEKITGFKGNNPYFYPPWFCLFFIPFTFLPFQIARFLWLLVSALLFYFSLNILKSAIDWQIKGWQKWMAYIFVTITFAAYCLASEQVGILLLFGVTLILYGYKQNIPILTSTGLIILVSKPQATFFALLFLGLWLLKQQPASIFWTAFWGIALLTTASIAIPKWWIFERAGFGKGLTYQLDGAEEVAALRVNSTIFDFLHYTFSFGAILQYILAATIGAIGAILVIYVWQKYNEPVTLTSVLLLLTLLVTPYALQYDYVPLTLVVFLVMMTFPLLTPPFKFAAIALLTFSFSTPIWQEWTYQGYWQLLGIFAAFSLTVNSISPSLHNE